MKDKKRNISTYSPTQMLSVIRKVCENYRTGLYTLESCCENAGVPYRTFKHWWKMYDAKGRNDRSRWAKLAEVAGLYEDAKQSKDRITQKKLVELAENRMEKRIRGFTFEEITTKVVPSTTKDGENVFSPVLIKKTVKHLPPSVPMIIFALTKLCPKKYGKYVEIFADDKQKPVEKHRSLQQIDEEIRLVELELSTLRNGQNIEA